MSAEDPQLNTGWSRTLRTVALSLLLLAAILYGGIKCIGAVFPVERIDYIRLPSPDGQAQMYVIRSNGGATTSFGYDIYVVESGAGASDSKLVATSYGGAVKGTWKDDSTLLIELFKPRDKTVVRDSVYVPVWYEKTRSVSIQVDQTP